MLESLVPSHVARLGMNYAFSRAGAIDVSGRYLDTRGDGGNDYTSWLVNASVLFRFK